MWQALGSSGAAGGAGGAGGLGNMGIVGNITQMAAQALKPTINQMGAVQMDGDSNGMQQAMMRMKNQASLPGANYMQGLPNNNNLGGGRALS